MGVGRRAGHGFRSAQAENRPVGLRAAEFAAALTARCLTRYNFPQAPAHHAARMGEYRAIDTPPLSAPGRGRGCRPGTAGFGIGANLSVAPGAHRRRAGRRQLLRHHRPSDRAVAVRASRPAIRHRQRGRAPAAISPPSRWRARRADGYTLLLVMRSNTDQRGAVREPATSISCATSRRSPASPACRW